jgi:hypothetical protein
MTTGQLKPDKKHRSLFVCVDCNTTYPEIMYFDRIDDRVKWGIRCNGHTITLCPWCKPDSKPWINGRGI